MGAEVSQSLLRWLRDHRAQMNDLLIRLAEAESPSLDPETQSAPFAILASELERIDYLVRRVRDGQAGDHLYARALKRRRGEPRQLLLGHMDTVWPVGTLATMPIHEDGELLFGPGVADMKGGLVEIVFALRALHELGLQPSVAPVVFVNTDEELGSADSTRLIRMLARGAERAFVLESGEGPDGRLKIARKGLGKFTITVRGRSAHAGADFEHGLSAILELSHQVQRLFALNDPTRGITVNVGTIDGGLRPNVVAPEAKAIVDVRAPTAASARIVEQAIRALKPVLEGASIEVEGGFGRRPMEPLPRNRALLGTAKRLGRDLGLSLEDAGLVGGGSDANTTSLVTATLDGLGPIGAGSHAADERIDISRLPERAALLALLLLEPVARPRLSARPRHRAPARPTALATRVALVGTDSSGTNAEMVKAWRALGIDAALVGPTEAATWIRPGDVVLGRLDILPAADGVEPGLLELLWLERRGVRVLNTARTLAAAHDKLLSARVLAGSGLPHPRSEVLWRGGAPPNIEPPLVIKPRLGSWGLDVVRCETVEELVWCLREIDTKPWFRRHGALVQELIPPLGYDLRLVVAANTVIGATRRVAAPGEWRTNIALGGSREEVTPSAAARKLGIAAAKAIGADLVGIDLLPTADGYSVIELNGAVDFNTSYSLPGRDIFEDAARALGLLPAHGAIRARRRADRRLSPATPV
jgi:glutamate carboxypeptidase